MTIDLNKIKKTRSLTYPEMARQAKVSKSKIERHAKSLNGVHQAWIDWYNKVFFGRK